MYFILVVQIHRDQNPASSGNDLWPCQPFWEVFPWWRQRQGWRRDQGREVEWSHDRPCDRDARFDWLARWARPTLTVECQWTRHNRHTDSGNGWQQSKLLCFSLLQRNMSILKQQMNTLFLSIFFELCGKDKPYWKQGCAQFFFFQWGYILCGINSQEVKSVLHLF